MADDGLKARDAKLIQYLNEAYGKERELETALQAHIQLATRRPYKQRLQRHLRETKGHARGVERRIKQLGGKTESLPAPGPELVGQAAGRAAGAASRAVAAAKGPLHALRGTGVQEKMLKNAKTEYFNEFEEIATYSAIETLADTVGDRETAKLARGIRREEERMAKFLERLIPSLTKAVAQEEIPASERRTTTRRRRRRSSSGGSQTRRRSSAASKSQTRRRSTSGRTSQARRTSSSRSRSSQSRSRSRSTQSRSRSGGSRSGGRTRRS
jgi:ferritin-like metal-binding protein YciE